MGRLSAEALSMEREQMEWAASKDMPNARAALELLDHIAALEAENAELTRRLRVALEQAVKLADAVESYADDVPPIMAPELAPLWEEKEALRAALRRLAQGEGV